MNLEQMASQWNHYTRKKIADHARLMRRHGYSNSTVRAAIRIHRIAAAQRSRS